MTKHTNEARYGRPVPARPNDGVAWITGASSGIGYALALELAREGWHVIASARSQDKLNALSAERIEGKGKITAWPLDVTNRDANEAAVKGIEAEHGPIALTVLNAGVFQPVAGEALDTDAFVKTFDVNLYGVVYSLVPLLAAMRQRGFGQIAMVSSVTGYGGLPSSAAYGATKAALINMAECLKFDTDKFGVLLQVVNPGCVDTPATEENAFEMPALVPVAKAAQRIAEGLRAGSFEITFPKRFTYALKLLQFLPYRAYFWLLKLGTKWNDRPLEPPLDHNRSTQD
ncbi:MAG: SDR family NAD(P)-dependent oxidoreductase [Pseudomonadota bacterium]